MIVNIDNIVTYLIEKKLLDSRSVVEGDLQVIDSSYKNRCVKVLRRNNVSYLIKQPTIRNVTLNSVQNEARLYKIVKNNPKFVEARELMPALVEFINRDCILITEYLRDAKSLREFLRTSPKEFNKIILAEELGKILARYHTSFSKINVSERDLNFLPKGIPYIFSIMYPDSSILTDLSYGCLQLIKIVQKDRKFCSMILDLSKEWRFDALVHGDIRWDNFVISYSSNLSFKIKLVDWEFADFGDPAWDIACIFQEFISDWLFSLPNNASESQDDMVTHSKPQIMDMKSNIRTFWYSYARTAKLSECDSKSLLTRSTKYCAVRLLQRSIESLQYSPEVSNYSIYFYQVSSNILSNSLNNTVFNLLGIPLNVVDIT
jgi:thiamine kinase-like enzyme